MTENANKSDDAIPKGSLVSDEEMAFYKKLFPSFDIITKRKIHCTVCRGHLGCAPGKESEIKMHPVLRVSQCTECHEFYSSGEFSRGEDGSELYCRWCGQGGQVYCCSSCPYVFCKSCIVENLNKGVVRDIEENDSWNCFSCSTKIIWPLRAMHWALTKYIAKEKESILNGTRSTAEIEELMALDNSTCCKSRTSVNRSAVTPNSQKRRATQSPQITQQPNKKTRSNFPNNQSPKVGSASAALAGMANNILEPNCQITTNAPPPLVMQSHQMTPNVINKPQQYRIPASIKQTIRPLGRPTTLNRGVPMNTTRMAVPRSATSGATSLGGGATTIRLSSNQMNQNPTIQRRQISTITATTTNTSGPVYHTINGYRIDLNSASKQDNYRLPNGKLIQVKRQVPVIPGGPQPQSAPTSATITSPTQTYSMNQYNVRPQMRAPIPQHIQQPPQQQQLIIQRNPPVSQQFIIHTPPMQQHMQTPPPPIQYRQIQTPQQVQSNPPANQPIPHGVIGQQNIALKSIPTFVKQIFPSTPLGCARNTLQSQLFHTMEICHHLMTKTHTLTNSNAYKTVHNLMDIKELYIHLSYLLTYAIGRFKGLQDKCLNDMKALGFTQEAKNLEKGQLAKDNLTNHNDDDLAIVEPQRDTIELDSDVEDDIPRIKIEKQDKHSMETTLNSLNMPNSSGFASNSDSEDIDLNVAADLLAGMLEVELTEGDPTEFRPPKAKLPRTKTTKRKQRPNSPTTQAERAKIKALQFLKDSDAKLKMNCQVVLERISPPLVASETDKSEKDVPSEEPKADEEKVVEPVEDTPNKEIVSEENPVEKDKESDKEKVIELDSADDDKAVKNDDGKKDQPLDDSDKLSVIELDDDDEKDEKDGKTDDPKEPEKSTPATEKPVDSEVIDLDDDEPEPETEKIEKEKTKVPEKTQSTEVINLDDDDEEADNDKPEEKKDEEKIEENKEKESETNEKDKMDVDEEEVEKDKEIINVEDSEKEVDSEKENDKNEETKESQDKSNDIFEISEDEEENSVNSKPVEEVSERKEEVLEEVVSKEKEESTSEEKKELISEKKEESTSEEKSESISEEKIESTSEDKEKPVEEIPEKEPSEEKAMEIEEEENQKEDSDAQELNKEENPQLKSTEKEISEEKDENSVPDSEEKNENSVPGTSNVEEMDTEIISNNDIENTENTTEQEILNEDSKDDLFDSKNSDDLSQSSSKPPTTDNNGKVYVDGKELDENDFESSSSSSEDEDDEQPVSKDTPVQDVEMRDLDSKETPSNGFGSENSSSNFDLIESMIKENLSVPTSDKSKIDDILTTTANEV